MKQDENTDAIAQLQQRIAYTFREPALLERALTHPSYLHDHADVAESNQRLEFLGDAVLQLALTEVLFDMFPGDREGSLSKYRSMLSKGKFLSDLAREIGLSEAMLVSASEDAAGGRNRDSALEDAFEALVGAIYIDSDLAVTRRVVLGLLGSLPERLASMKPAENPKGRLQELVQPAHGNNAVRYVVEHAAGSDHAKEYEAVVFINDKPMGRGRGTSKKAAEEGAALEALESFNVETDGA
ncbi:ribonuclease-3 [Ereboglobus sp. PH5-10]|uniref:ribonuclease III n=1 Tax=Ereboglobus sp. PH5-10 TaxID=2940629 RepID=UPI002404DBDB|nr:ribonuclease III [Ereboglobus sp. PH5-10]MDF9826193.1 ribonuclease-3 [Ereboglobus sp. PH5-10]